AVESIDLSRFNRKPGNDDTDTESEPEPAPAPAAPIVVPPTDIIPAVPGDAPISVVIPAGIAGAIEGSGVAGARVEESAAETVRPIASLNPVFTKEDLKKADGNLVKLEDNEVPLAAMPVEDGIDMSWWWILIIALLGATGKKMYDEHQKKAAAKEEANR
ncbi:MAG: hypothetical protein K6G58_04890, partial [Lachnospiraceae bacterium]|nr:hypothetical protein [Lachnospiraceae bacterium]